MPQSKTASIIGGGVIGGGWAARFLLSGWNVKVFDPAPETAATLQGIISSARRTYPALFDKPLPAEGQLEMASNLPSAVMNSDWIQESVPEQLNLKCKVYRQIQEHSTPDSIIASSTSGFKPSDLRNGALRPSEIIVAHPFNPVYLLPLVEIVLAPASPAETAKTARSILTSIGMHPIEIGREIEGHIADRLLESAWREALWLVHDGYATTEEIDECVRLGFGLRWAQMGIFETYRLGGGKQGMKRFLEQFGPCLKLPWTHLMEVPEMTEGFATLIAEQSDQQSAHLSISELERQRDDNLVSILRSLKSCRAGAGNSLLALEDRLFLPPVTSSDLPMITADRIIPPDWIDYNGHMNEARYLELFSKATDAFLWNVGCDEDYVATGKSYFTLETNLRHLDEAFAGQHVTVETVCLFGEGKKLHLLHVLLSDKGTELAVAEHLLLHVDLERRKSCSPSAAVSDAIAGFAYRHRNIQLRKTATPKLGFN